MTDASGSPLANATITIYTGTGGSARWAYTDGAGRYSAGGLTTGTYYVEASGPSPASVTTYYNGLSCSLSCPGVTTTTPINVTTGVTTPGINFALPAAGRITGTVKSAATNGVLSGVAVRIYNSTATTYTSAVTDASGVYSFSSAVLGPGTYFLRTANSLGYVDQLYSGFSCPGGACTITSGTPVVLSAGATATADFSLTLSGSIGHRGGRKRRGSAVGHPGSRVQRQRGAVRVVRVHECLRTGP